MTALEMSADFAAEQVLQWHGYADAEISGMAAWVTVVADRRDVLLLVVEAAQCLAVADRPQPGEGARAWEMWGRVQADRRSTLADAAVVLTERFR